jgi:hypothetical protein
LNREFRRGPCDNLGWTLDEEILSWKVGEDDGSLGNRVLEIVQHQLDTEQTMEECSREVSSFVSVLWLFVHVNVSEDHYI